MNAPRVTGNAAADTFLAQLDGRINGTIGSHSPESRRLMDEMRPHLRIMVIANPEGFRRFAEEWFKEEGLL